MISIRAHLAFPLVGLVSLAWSSPAWPAWPHDPLPSVRFAPVVSDQVSLGTVADGKGGAYIVFDDNRAGSHDIYVQRLTASGSVAPGWPATGLAVCTAVDIQMVPVAVADGGGGVYVAWDDARS